MKIIRIICLLLVLVFIVSLIPGYSTINYSAVNRSDVERANTVYDDLIMSYLAGEDVGAVDLGDGTIKIALDTGEYILAAVSNNLLPLKKGGDKCSKNVKRSVSVTYHGEITKPAYPISNTVLASKLKEMTHTYQVSSTFGYQISGSPGVSIETFEAELGTALNREYTISEAYTFTMPENHAGTIYGYEVYDKYTYYKDGWFFDAEATLLAPKRYLIYFLVQ